MSRVCKFKPIFSNKRKDWRVRFPAGFFQKNKKEKYFKSEEEAKEFVLSIVPDAYDIKIETERKCRKCSQILPIENFIRGLTRCKSCKAKEQAKNREIRKESNVCASCENEKLKGSVYCFNHWFANNASKNLNNSNLGIDLINLYEKQNRKCVYSGVELIPAVNMSLDHIVSRYDNKDLTYDINNVQWVHKDINTMKSKFSHDNFILLCKYIANKF
jgi:hypothetical protein